MAKIINIHKNKNERNDWFNYWGEGETLYSHTPTNQD